MYLEDVLKVLGEYKDASGTLRVACFPKGTLLHKQSPDGAWTNEKLRLFNPRRWVLSV